MGSAHDLQCRCVEGLKLLRGTLAQVVACVCHKFIGLNKHN